MMNQEPIGFDDIRTLSESITCLRSNDFDQALSLIKKVSFKYDDLKSGKLNKSNTDYSKYKSVKEDDFKSHLQLISSKFKIVLETIEKHDSYYAILLYNHALILDMLQQYYQCSKVLEILDNYRSLLDEFTYFQFLWLRLDNYLNIQSPDAALKLIESEFPTDDNKTLSDLNKSIYECFLLKIHLQLNDINQTSTILERLNRIDFSITLFFIEANVFYNSYKLLNSMQCLTSIPFLNDNFAEKDISLYWNNLGCIYFHLNKHSVGTMYINRSLSSLENRKSRSNRDLFINRHYKIIHNLGVQLLFSGRPVDAFDLLLEVVNVYPKNPRLWLRLAECCIKAYKSDQSDVDSKTKFISNVIGADKFKKVILDNEIKECKQPWEEVAAMPTPTLEFGSLCIQNALFLLPNQPEFGDINFDLKNMKLIEWYKNQCIYVNPGGCVRGTEIIHLQSALLLNGAYISICLNNYVEAYKFSEKLLHQPILSPNHKYLARMYMSEAMLMMNSCSNINPLMNPVTQVRLSSYPETSFDHNNEIESNMYSVVPKSNNFPTTLEEAQSIMFYNWGVVYAILHQDKFVEQCLYEAVKLNPKLKMSSNYVYLAIYCEIRQGKTKNALKILEDVCSNIPMISNIEI